MKSEKLAANASHELRTPINLIVGFSEVMITSPRKSIIRLRQSSYRADIHAAFIVTPSIFKEVSSMMCWSISQVRS
ncbi:MAG: histidine kinase dimerization/phospho-acceptor domain-containing protein [Anaerolineae bacterium]|nr:histidine kinase dimerization/phospho-acceptor domain-containing protein [Anaerolineae bacterium]